MFLSVKILLKRETIFILTGFHILVPNTPHSDKISIFFFSCQDLPDSLCHVAVYILVFLIPESLFSFTVVRHLEQEAEDFQKALSTSTGWPSGKLLHLIKENYLQPLEKDQSHSYQLKRCTDYLQIHSIRHLLEKISAGTSKAEKAPNFRIISVII